MDGSITWSIKAAKITQENESDFYQFTGIYSRKLLNFHNQLQFVISSKNYIHSVLNYAGIRFLGVYK